MKRRLLLAGCVLSWGLAVPLGAAELVFICAWAYYGGYAAEAASAVLWGTMLLLPLLLIALCTAVYTTVLCKKHSGRKPGEKR